MSKTTSWISLTPSLLQGVKTINKVDDQKFPFVLERIVQFIQTPSESSRPFSTEEEEKLMLTLPGIESKEALESVLETSTLIFTQAVYHLTKPTVLQKDLVDVLQMSPEKAEAFASVWTNSAKSIFDKLRQKSIHPAQLDNCSWMMNVTANSSSRNQVNEPRAIIELKLKEETSQDAANVVMDLNHKQLSELYFTLETIQSELDSLR